MEAVLLFSLAFLAAAGGLESAGATGLVGTGVRVGVEILGNGGAGITFGRVGAVGGAIGRICRGARFTAGACRAVRVNFRTGFRAVRFFLVVRFRIDLGGRSLIVPDLVEDRPPENTGNFGIGAAYVPRGQPPYPGYRAGVAVRSETAQDCRSRCNQQ